LSAFTSSSSVAAVTAFNPQSQVLRTLRLGTQLSWQLFGCAAFLVSVPVFLQAPLVRQWPWLSLVLTLAWVGLGFRLQRQTKTAVWGDLFLGFSLSWLAGSIYWGWFRWEPLFHLPIEAIGAPWALWILAQHYFQISPSQTSQSASVQPRYWVGALFYLGSLLGTAVTDLYFYVVHLVPYWRQLMQTPEQATPILQAALQQMQTPWGLLWVGILASVLCLCGCMPFVNITVFRGYRRSLHWWVFSGAVLSTLLVDGLFWLAAGWA
jgi:hypothetical protein